VKLRFVQVVALALALFAMYGVGAGAASAAPVPTFADACGAPTNFDFAVCERVDYIAAEDSAIDDNTTLMWWGVWFACGLLLVLVIAPNFSRAWRFFRE
jgi:hypothetical protein